MLSGNGSSNQSGGKLRMDLPDYSKRIKDANKQGLTNFWQVRSWPVPPPSTFCRD